jgi:hypothetical protein
MGTRQPARLSPTPVYGIPEATVPNARSGPSGVLPLLVLVVVLAAAAVWYVALPAFDQPVAQKRTCEVVVLASGATACVEAPGRKAKTAHKPAGRAKR